MTRSVFTTGQVAKLTNVAPRTVSKWFDSGRLKGYRIPGSNDRRVPRDKLIEFLRENHMPQADDLLEEMKIHVLTVGLDETTRSLMSINDERIVVNHTASLFEGGIKAKQHGQPPKLVVLDCTLGNNEVRQAIRFIRGDDLLSECVIIVTSFEDGAEQFEGATVTLKRPFDPMSLADQLRIYTDAA